jgi:hypothetical protein
VGAPPSPSALAPCTSHASAFLCMGVGVGVGVGAVRDSGAVVPPLQSRAVSPAELKKLTNFTNTVLLTLYVPTLPRWRNFSQVGSPVS